jgi:hypothetical protein
MGYILSWVVYLIAAAGLVGLYCRFFEGYLPRVWGLILRVLMITVLFTPWVVEGANGYQPAPAFIAVLFSVLAHARDDALRALAPIVGVSLLVIGVMVFSVRPDDAESPR